MAVTPTQQPSRARKSRRLLAPTAAGSDASAAAQVLMQQLTSVDVTGTPHHLVASSHCYCSSPSHPSGKRCHHHLPCAPCSPAHLLGLHLVRLNDVWVAVVATMTRDTLFLVENAAAVVSQRSVIQMHLDTLGVQVPSTIRSTKWLACTPAWLVVHVHVDSPTTGLINILRPSPPGATKLYPLHRERSWLDL